MSRHKESMALSYIPSKFPPSPLVSSSFFFFQALSIYVLGLPLWSVTLNLHIMLMIKYSKEKA